jgi:hypothetical protein
LTLITPFANAIPNQPVAAVTARNLGRRPIYIGLAGLQYYPTPFERLKKRLTKKWPDNTFCQVIQKSLSGIKLGEGDPPARFDFNQDNAALSKHSKYWKRVRGFVEDSAGQFYFSPSVDPRPSWAGGRPWKPSR